MNAIDPSSSTRLAVRIARVCISQIFRNEIGKARVETWHRKRQMGVMRKIINHIQVMQEATLYEVDTPVGDSASPAMAVAITNIIVNPTTPRRMRKIQLVDRKSFWF